MARPTGKPIDQGIIARVVSGVRWAVSGKAAEDWFGPQQPLEPMAPPSAAGRQFDYRPGFNLSGRPRADEPITFQQLRALADNYDLMRLVIETRKDQLTKCKWAIQPKDPKKKGTGDGRVSEVSDFLAYPDKEHDWDTWQRMLLEDHLVVDAATLYPRLDRKGRLYALEPVDGTTIKRLLDQNGRTPMPPYVAYQQFLKGMPATDYTRSQLLYLPRNMRTSRVYGLGPVEQVVMTVNIAMRRQIHQLDYYTEGTVPAALAGVPDGWTPEQIAQYQEYWDALMSDETSQRRKVRWVPGSIAKSFVQTKDAALKDEMDEWLARIMCYAFSVSNQPFIKQQSRAESETSAVQAMKEGLAPIMKWVKSVIDRVIWQIFGYVDLEFIWQEEEDTDPLIQAQINDIKVRAGAKTINEWRASDGDEAIAGGDVPLIYTATGAVRLEDAIEPPKPPEPVPDALLDNNSAPPVAENDDTAKIGGEDGGPPKKMSKAAKIGEVDRNRPFVRKGIKKLRRLWARFLASEGARIADQVAAAMGKMAKAADDGADGNPDVTGGQDVTAEQIAAEAMDQAAFAKVGAKTVETIKAVAADGATEGLKSVGITTADATSLANPRAVTWAEAHGAELVGGLEDTTRDALRDLIVKGEQNGWGVEQLKKAIMESHAFSADRAALIAQHEMATADIMGNLIGWRTASETFGLKLTKRWIYVAEEKHCSACIDNAAAGPIPLDDTFPSGQEAAPAHPRCGCDLVASVARTSEKWEGPASDGPFDQAALAKQNLNHDRLGRFARAAETGSGSGGRGTRGHHLGPMPHEVLSRTLGRKIAPGPVVMSSMAQGHHQVDHPEDIAAVKSALAGGLDNPRFIGSPKLGGDGLNAALYYPVPGGKGAMAAIPVSLDLDKTGVYRARSGFIVSPEKVKDRLDKGIIIRAQ